MSGHSHAKNVMRKKQTEDQKRAASFGKLLRTITVAALQEPNPDFNPRLRSAIDKARQNNVPLDTITRAIKKTSEVKDLEELTLEAYGPEGVAILIKAITDNKNRTIPEIKSLLTKAGAKWAESGSVLWAFTEDATGNWLAKFPQSISATGTADLAKIVSSLSDHDDVSAVFTTASN